MKRIGQEIEIRIIVTKLNYKKLKRILDFIQKDISRASRIVVIFLEYEGQAIKNFEDVKLAYKYFKQEFNFFKPYLGKDKEIRFYHFPLCVVPHDFWPYLWRTLRNDEVTFLSKCEKCKVKEFCLGIHKNYLKLFGRKEFNPIQGSFLIESNNNYNHPIVSVKKQ